MTDVRPREQWSDCTAKSVEVTGREMQHVTRHHTPPCAVYEAGLSVRRRELQGEPFDVLMYNRMFYKVNKSASSVTISSKY